MFRTLIPENAKAKNNRRCIAQASVLVVTLLLTSGAAVAADQTISGPVVVQDCGMMTVNGQRVRLWGLDALAPDQKCWQDDQVWNCGEEAIMALQHMINGHVIDCTLKTSPDAAGPTLAQCFMNRQGWRIDIAERLIRQGWALERGEASGGIYYDAEQYAQANKRGVWSGRFQTAQDWREGIQRFVGEDDETPAEQAE